MRDPRQFTCRACARLARPGDAYCSEFCRIAHIHQFETRENHAPVLEHEAAKVNDGRLYVNGMRLPLQNSA
jgi:hypothetical protein